MIASMGRMSLRMLNAAEAVLFGSDWVFLMRDLWATSSLTRLGALIPIASNP